MIYLDPTPNPSGAYPNPKLQPFPGCISLEGEGEALFFQCNGFVTLGEDGSVSPNTQAWEAWKASLPQQEPESAPTVEERVSELEETLDMLLTGVTE